MVQKHDVCNVLADRKKVPCKCHPSNGTNFFETSSTSPQITAVAEIITELVRFKPEICICDGNEFEFKRASVSIMRDLLLSLPQISL